MKKIVYILILFLFCASSCTADIAVRVETPQPSPAPATATDEDVYHGRTILEGYRICIDPGHQAAGNSEKEFCAPWSEELKAKCTSGASGNYTGTEEYLLNLAIAQKVRQKLIALGADVLMTREMHDVDLSNKERAEAANRFGADITLRIHCNSAESAAAEGLELYVRGAGDGTAAYREKAEEDYQKASKLLEFLRAETGAVSRGVFRSDAYTGINWCDHTCIIVECGFLSNEKEDRLLNTAAYQDRIAEGIKNYFVSSRVSSDKKISGL